MKRKITTRVLALALVLVTVLGVFSGCGTTEPENTTETTTAKTDATDTTTSAGSETTVVTTTATPTEPEIPEVVKSAFEFCSEFLEKRARTELLNEDQGLQSYVPDESDEAYLPVYHFAMLAESLGKCNEFEELLGEEIETKYVLDGFTINGDTVTVTISEELKWINTETKGDCKETNFFRIEVSTQADGFKINNIEVRNDWEDYNEIKNENIDWEKKLVHMLYSRGYVPDIPDFEGSVSETEIELLPEDIGNAYIFAMEFIDKIEKTKWLHSDEALYEYLPDEDEWYYRTVYDFIMYAELRKAIAQHRENSPKFGLDITYNLREYKTEYGRIVLRVSHVSLFYSEIPMYYGEGKSNVNDELVITLLPTENSFQIMDVYSPYWGIYDDDFQKITDWNAELKRHLNWKEGDPFEPIEPLVP